MTILKGKGIFGGIVFGRVKFYKRKKQAVKRYKVDNVEFEINRFKVASKTAEEQLQQLYKKALLEVGEANAMIFEIHKMMLDDLDYQESIIGIIQSQSVNAEYAISVTAEHFSEMFSLMEDSYMKERAIDVKDVSNRLLDILLNHSNDSEVSDEPYIIVADDLAPSETVQIDKNKVIGFVTQRGSSNSHTAILARTMNIPAIVAVRQPISEDIDGCMAILDGFSGDLFINPDSNTIDVLRKKQREKNEYLKLLQSLKGKPNITKDGKRINIYANIRNSNDVSAALQNDAEGIGLFRSEFLYLENSNYPSEDEQFAVYKDVVEKMSGKRVIIRTLDIGADKKIDYFNLPEEENPAMGYRAIRICLKRPSIFKTQLRALYRASAFGKLSIMFPMIISVSEVLEIKKMIKEVKNELLFENLEYSDDVEIGIMIETPAAVLISDELAKEVDFFSIGTNDLTQYTLAVDRQNESLTDIYDPHHKAVLRLIKIAAENAHKNGIWIGICGELAADVSLTETFLSIGIDELSVSPSFILEIRKRVIESNIADLKENLLYNI